MEQALDGLPRTYTIRRSQHLGYGFMAGYESPTMVKIVEPNGPSYKRLLPGDVILAVNGIDVERCSREQIIKMIQLSDEEIQITVRQQTYEEMIRAKNLADPKFYTLNKSYNNLSSNGQFRVDRPVLPQNPSPLNRLVTSISQQQPDERPLSSQFACGNFKSETPPVQIKPSVLMPKPTNGVEQNDENVTRTLGRNHRISAYGRHSPLPQRCKSSMDGAKRGNQDKKSGDEDNDQPLLKRSNTMRPIKLPSKVREIFEVVIKIFFEDGHTRLLNYNQDTTVGVILSTLNARLTGSSPHAEQIKRYFGLALTFGVNTESSMKEQNLKAKRKNTLHILDENDPIIKIRQLPYAPILRLLYRMVYPPSDVNVLYSQDKVAFEYLYQQSCNDLKLERFLPELDQDIALKLSALHLLEYVHSNHSRAHGNSKDPKVYMKLIKKAPGIEYFLPMSIARTIVDKKGKRIKEQFKKFKARLKEQLRKNFEEFDFEPPKVKSTTNLTRNSSTSFHELSLPEMQSSPSDYIKLLFLNYLSQLPCYGNSERPVRTSASPVEQTSAGGCSSSPESVPRTSDSSPLIKQDRYQVGQNSNGRTETTTNSNTNNISRLAQMNSMRSLSSVQSSSISQPVDQPDMVQTPSIESISSITFNMQSSPSPQQAPLYLQQTQQSESYLPGKGQPMNLEPSPMPRQQVALSKMQDYSSIDKLYSQRYMTNHRPIEELLKNVILLPPPPPSSMLFDDMSYHMASRGIELRPTSHLTQVLTDRDIEKLRVPPPPRMFN